LNGKFSDYKIKGTLGITAQSQIKVEIYFVDYDLDVGFSHPRYEGVSNGSAVRRLKRNMS